MLSFFGTSSLVQSMSLKKLSLNRGDGLKLNTNAFNLPIMNDILNLSYAFCRLLIIPYGNCSVCTGGTKACILLLTTSCGL